MSMHSTHLSNGATRPIRGLRWYIIGLIFIATCINYIDRSSIGLLFTRFGAEIHVSREAYGWVGAMLLLAYTVSQSVSGRIYDRYGARVGFTLSIVIWCIAAMGHSLITGFASFAAASFFLGLGEAGNWPGAAKVVAEWFPQRERAVGMAIFNGGASMGGVIGPPFVAAVLEPFFGWRTTFVILGALGFFWLAAWLMIYRPASSHPRLSAQERTLILDGRTAQPTLVAPSLKEILRHRQTWGILAARLLVDPIWWLYILWLPTYLKDVHHLSLKDIGAFQWAPYLCAAIGSLFGGWLAGRLITRGRSVNTARKIVIGAAACLMPFGILAAHVHSTGAALACIAVVLFGFQMWISNVQTLPSDFFSSSSVGSVAGLGGTAAGLSSLFFNLCTGWLVTHLGYGFVLTLAGVLGPVGAIVLFLLIGPIKHIQHA
ncbi:MFS transporter [Terriglobus tenax]|uniref:MFS transporter n=1 Tax=Terriglobus tenax TaxID=1111115 RepID=UPI0021DF9FB5|nr:MFS transporter [Terriglobus tenax]